MSESLQGQRKFNRNPGRSGPGFLLERRAWPCAPRPSRVGRSRFDQEGLEVGIVGEVRGHGMALEADMRREGFGNHPPEAMVGEAPTIGGTEEPAPGREAGGGEGDEFSVVFLGTEDLAPVVA